MKKTAAARCGRLRKEGMHMKKTLSPGAWKKTAFPKYTTQLMNLANQTAQGTRPKVVGQMSELFPQ